MPCFVQDSTAQNQEAYDGARGKAGGTPEEQRPCKVGGLFPELLTHEKEVNLSRAT